MNVVSKIRDYLGVEASGLAEAKFVDYRGERVCIVQCARSGDPVFVGKHNDEEFVIRSGPRTVRLSIGESVRFIRSNFPNYGLRSKLEVSGAE